MASAFRQYLKLPDVGLRHIEDQFDELCETRSDLNYFSGRFLELCGKDDLARDFYARCLTDPERHGSGPALSAAALRDKGVDPTTVQPRQKPIPAPNPGDLRCWIKTTYPPR